MLAVAFIGTLWAPGNAASEPSASALRRALVESARASRDREPRLPGAGSALELRSGVAVDGLRSSAGGYMLDLRLRVLDARKAAPLLGRKHQPRLIASDGSVLRVPVAPKLGALRQAPAALEPGATYFALFANPGQKIQRGDRVRVELSDSWALEVVVE
jgi:hypothetical protein